MWVAVNKNCADCGVLMENVCPARKRCPECSGKRYKAYQKRRTEDRRAKRNAQAKAVAKNEHMEYCKGCKYWFGDYEYNQCCNYIFIKGHRRPCPPGEKCTVKETRK